MLFSLFPNPYIAIIGDIKESRKLEKRGAVQEKLRGVLNEINEAYSQDISSKFLITLGDEFQGLLCNGANALRIISEIEMKMHPVKLRFGVGVGAITTDIIREMSIGADGPGYYRAREAIHFLKDNEKRNQTNKANIRVEVDGDNQAPTTMINTILSLMSVIKDSWSDRQREIIWNMMEYQDGQTNVANRLHITQATVHKGLASGKYYAYKEALDTIGKALGEIRRDHV